jgi:hypothetical protein
VGQYFKPVVLGEDGNITHWMSSSDFDNFTKLMEHSYLNNDFVQAFETLLTQEAPVRVVWAGDYADPEKDAEGDDRVIVSENYTAGQGPANLWILATESGLQPYRPDVKGFAMRSQPTKRRKKDGSFVWRRARDRTVFANAWPKVQVTVKSHPYLINWDKKLYVDKRLIDEADGFRLHPLPLLTAEGNGRGGGDFDGEDPNHLVGSWARDHLSVSDHVAHDGFEELKFDLS